MLAQISVPSAGVASEHSNVDTLIRAKAGDRCAGSARSYSAGIAEDGDLKVRVDRCMNFMNALPFKSRAPLFLFEGRRFLRPFFVNSSFVKRGLLVACDRGEK